ncbi:hypothetical protein AYI68_g57 [Smittium mucronatum]|uniref:Uncharacterized protein n=1 Tax=Smittium mucronatum TaxID=133383 RepID=A0A1R0H9G9_9FUNG|nr:hypothetical protein AYI68_g57 [Smittium mucronatum]
MSENSASISNPVSQALQPACTENSIDDSSSSKRKHDEALGTSEDGCNSAAGSSSISSVDVQGKSLDASDNSAQTPEKDDSSIQNGSEKKTSQERISSDSTSPAAANLADSSHPQSESSVAQDSSETVSKRAEKHTEAAPQPKKKKILSSGNNLSSSAKR